MYPLQCPKCKAVMYVVNWKPFPCSKCGTILVYIEQLITLEQFRKQVA